MNFADALRAAKHKAGETVLPEGAHFHASVPAIAQGQLPPAHVYQPTPEPKPVSMEEPKPKAKEAPKTMANVVIKIGRSRI